MSKLLSRVQTLVQQSRSQLVTPSVAASQGQGAYGEALRLMWGGKAAEASGRIATMLADDPNIDLRFAAYRLWIESLAEQGDHGSLALVRDLLFRLGQAEPQARTTFIALRGVAHFELDEFSAASLLARTMQDETDDPYCLELVQLVASRGSQQKNPALAQSTAPLTDYFHWQTLARGLLRNDQRLSLEALLAGLRETCPEASLSHTFEFHLCVESSFYAGAALVAERLVTLYPDSEEYRYYLAYAFYEDGDYPSARNILSDMLQRGGQDDAEVCGLYGHTLAKLGNAEQSAQYLRRAVALLKSEGLPTSHISLELADVEDELRGDGLDPALTLPRMTRKWLINLSARRYHELITSSPSTISRLLRPMGAEPMPGDLCFFAASNKDEKGRDSQWKIVAIYAVDSMPIWHPTHGYHSALRLVSRLPDGLPVDIRVDDESGVTPTAQPQLSRREQRQLPIAHGVYELDNSALDIIEETVHMSREDMIERRRGSSQSRRPTA